jgi:hypothetical protein
MGSSSNSNVNGVRGRRVLFEWNGVEFEFECEWG